MVRDTVSLVHASLKDGKSVLVEGANAAMLDIDFGSLTQFCSESWTFDDNFLFAF